MDEKSKLREYVREICEKKDFILLAADIHQSRGSKLIRIIADTEEGITLNQCTALSREIENIIFRKNIITGNYRLEVTSPGLDKPLEHDYEFQRNTGREVKVKYSQDEKIEEITGTLKSYNGDKIEIEKKNKKFSVLVDDIIEVKIKLKW